jgi:FlaA1/EpsC-like NDP-sugar epimerase
MAVKDMTGGETFVFKNPSYKVTDICKAMAPDAKMKIVGIREGEKIHEVMITKDDSRSTYDYGDYYIIYPNFEWFDFNKSFKEGGKPLEDGFEYNSGNNTEWLSVEDIHKLLIDYKLI